ncbi:unnamed protein product [Eruca vesicaria subsp. sativa]|uniref:F-box domain-containing protein n=1 Tax=Eruca vesicaria subsp. sativa TaxID=29727 RepID=A0ABC8KT59_ERUVS|nr:unnamed protein product [Eruca vesicaria subsp. sativa]
MVEISDIPVDDGVNGGASTKKPQEAKTSTSLESLPIDLLEQIVARVPRSDHPAVSVLSTTFRRLIASPGFRHMRSQLAITEHVLYALVGFPPRLPRWYILYRNRLRRVITLPPMPYGAAVVTIGHEIYVIGGSNNERSYLPNVTLVDCRTHTYRPLPSMRVARYRAAAGVVDGKIYVIGGCRKRSERDWVEWFDPERQVWLARKENLFYACKEFVTYDVVKEKIYGLGEDHYECLNVYDPRECTLQPGLGESELRGFLHASSCVVDDMLCTIDVGCMVGHPIIVYDGEDPGSGVWKPVRGVYGLPPCLYWYAYESKMANVGGRKLVILVGSQSQLWNYYGDKYIWCVEIALERSQEDGEIRGRVESVEVVFKTTNTTPTIELCRAVCV